MTTSSFLPPEHESDDAEGRGPDHSVLIVDDDPGAQRLMTCFLTGAAHLDTAESTAQARRRLQETTYDLVLMDIDLGSEMDGVTLMQQMRDRMRAVLAVTAYALPGDREKYLAAGFDGYLAKPFTRRQFQRAVQDVLALR